MYVVACGAYNDSVVFSWSDEIDAVNGALKAKAKSTSAFVYVVAWTALRAKAVSTSDLVYAFVLIAVSTSVFVYVVAFSAFGSNADCSPDVLAIERVPLPIVGYNAVNEACNPDT